MTNTHPHAEQLETAAETVQNISDSLESLEQLMDDVADSLRSSASPEFANPVYATSTAIAELRELSRKFAAHSANLRKAADQIPEM